MLFDFHPERRAGKRPCISREIWYNTMYVSAFVSNMVLYLMNGQGPGESVGNGFIRSANQVRYAECMNAFPTRGGGRLPS